MNFNIDIFKNYDTFIFDFDGTLIDSEPYNKLAHSKVLSKLLNKDFVLSDKDYERYVGKSDIEIYDMFKKDFNLNFDSEEMAKMQAEISRDLLLDNKVKIYKYFWDIAKNNSDKKFYVVSNHHEIGLFPVLEKKGIIDYLDNVFCLSADNISKEYFYKNISEFIPDAKKVIVFEDSPKVLELVTKLGYDAIAIQSELNANTIDGKYKYIIKV